MLRPFLGQARVVQRSREGCWFRASMTASGQEGTLSPLRQPGSRICVMRSWGTATVSETFDYYFNSDLRRLWQPGLPYNGIGDLNRLSPY